MTMKIFLASHYFSTMTRLIKSCFLLAAFSFFVEEITGNNDSNTEFTKHQQSNLLGMEIIRNKTKRLDDFLFNATELFNNIFEYHSAILRLISTDNIDKTHKIVNISDVGPHIRILCSTAAKTEILQAHQKSVLNMKICLETKKAKVNETVIPARTLTENILTELEGFLRCQKGSENNYLLCINKISDARREYEQNYEELISTHQNVRIGLVLELEKCCSQSRENFNQMVTLVDRKLNECLPAKYHQLIKGNAID